MPSAWLEKNLSWAKFFYTGLIGLIIFARFPSPYTTPGFWAEDATYFFVQAFENGASTLFTPVYGYHFLLGRLIAYFATFWPVYYSPLIYSWACLVVAAFVCSYFSKDTFKWIIPNRWHRIWVCVLIAIGPGTGDLFASLCNMSSGLTLLAFLILLERPFAFTKINIASLTFLALSAGQTFILIPLALFLWRQTKRKEYLRVVLWILIPMTLVNFVGNHFAGTQAGLLEYKNIILVPKILVENFFIRVFFVPFLGERWTAWVMSQSNFLFWPLCALIGYLAAKFSRSTRIDRSKLAVLGVGVLVMLSSYGIIAIVRSYALHQILKGSGHPWWNLRYQFLPAASVFIFWFALLVDWRARLRSGRRVLISILILVMTLNCLLQWRGATYRRPINWAQVSDHIESALALKRGKKLGQSITIQNIGLHPDYYHGGMFSLDIRGE